MQLKYFIFLWAALSIKAMHDIDFDLNDIKKLTMEITQEGVKFSTTIDIM